MVKIKLTNQTRYAVEGRLVTMDVQSTIIPSGVLYIEGDTIIDVRESSDPAPDGFSKQMIIKSGGTIYPGMIELHNHLSYNIIPTWHVPKLFLDRDQWRRDKDYRKKMTGPLKVLGGIDGYLQAIVRFVECRLLFSGVTSSQGITLASHQNIKRHYKGVVRNVEQTVDEDLPTAKTRIADITEAEKLKTVLDKGKCYLLHLAEGVPQRANKHFKALQISPGDWAINESLVGIHAVGLLAEDFEIMGAHKGSMVWSPMSNLLLYGVSADIASAKENGVMIGLGADWSASGSKNLLCELKVARLISEEQGNLFSDEELVRMVTSNAARILQWDHHLGSLEPGKKADLIVLTGKTDDPYRNLIDAREQTISWVIIDGWPRIGQKRTMEKFDIGLEEVRLGRSRRYLHLNNEIPDNPISLDLTYAEGRAKLEEGMANLPQLAKKAEETHSGIFSGAKDSQVPRTRWQIYSDHEDHPDSSQRHHLPFENETTGGSELDQAAVILSEILEPMELDRPAIAVDKHYFKKLAIQKNLPEYIKLKLPTFYGEKIDLSDVESYVKKMEQPVRSHFDYIYSLARFYETSDYLSVQDHLNIIDQASALLSQAYVHLPLKRAMHASHPLDRLRILRFTLKEDDTYIRDIEFHKELIRIFNLVRDLHTTYQLPAPYKDKVAFLPFFIEEYFEEDEPRYMVSKLIGKSPAKNFKKGVTITRWNNVPIQRAIKLNGERYAGSNPASRYARGLDSMTFRPLAVMLPPDEEQVTVEYKYGSGRKRRITLPWMVGSIHSRLLSGIDETEGSNSRLSSGYDYPTYMVQNVKKVFFAAGIVKAEQSFQEKRTFVAASAKHMETSFPGHLRAKKIVHNGHEIGYIRIFSFATREPEELVGEFIRLIGEMPENGIILDVHSNGGGNILAAEWMLQALSMKPVTPQPAQFINTPLVEELCRLHSPSNTLPELDLTLWHQSIKEMRQTGAVYSLEHPITPPRSLTKFRANKKLKLVLITDALCYSATDIFASGFQDHKLGKILGIHDNTGAGGANVWTHTLLNMLTRQADGKSKYFRPLPYGANFRVAVRRTLRVGANAGIPLEGLGVKPDILHRMTKDDLLKENKDLISRACEVLI
ncbi:MAG: amidohydrolase family protein [Bacteroidota bacterium]